MFRLYRNSLEKLYFSFVRPILEYSDAVYDNCTGQQSKNLKEAQLAAARAMTGATRGTSHRLLYEETKWETLASRRKNHRLKMYYKICKDNRTPESLKELIPERTSERTSYNLRTAELRSTPAARTQLLYESFIPSTTRDWNILPREMREARTIEAFSEGLTKRERKPVYFNAGTRKGQIKHARLRLRCSKLNTHLFERNLTETDMCNCGKSKETVKHYLLECENYDEIRDEMYRDLDMTTTLTSDMMLYGSDDLTQNENKIMFETVQKFILKTERL